MSRQVKVLIIPKGSNHEINDMRRMIVVRKHMKMKMVEINEMTREINPQSLEDDQAGESFG